MKTAYTSSFSSGAVSLFSVVFAILLMSVVSISFIRIMIDDQSRAADADLSQSAYDSAQAGVEDAKRALIWCRSNDLACTADLLDTCNKLILTSGVVKVGAEESGASGPVQVQSVASSDQDLNQAYTCVTVKKDTDDYLGNLTANQSAVIPLIANNPYDALTIEWFSRDDVTSDTGTVTVPTTANQPLLAQKDWGINQPSVLRTQYMQTSGTFTLSDFDYTHDDGASNANTVFLYPLSAGTSSRGLTEADQRQNSAGESLPDSASNTPLPTRCKTSVSGGGYACKMTLSLPAAVNGAKQAAYLRLTAFYNATHFRITFTDTSGTPTATKFEGVQAIIDSTGRASDLYRRVQSRVDLYDTGFPYPEAAVDVNGDFCKNFGVIDKSYNGSPTYTNNDATCTP